MRVTGGLVRGRGLAGPKSGRDFLRPTCDRVREALFNILGDRVRGALALDLFAGTGAWGIEALSRGATFALFVDASPVAGRLVAENLGRCLRDMPGAGADFLLLRISAATRFADLAEKIPPPHRINRFDLVFLDPPYEKNLAETTLTGLAGADILAEHAVIVAEERSRARLPERVGCYKIFDRRAYGESGLWLYANHPEPGA